MVWCGLGYWIGYSACAGEKTAFAEAFHFHLGGHIAFYGGGGADGGRCRGLTDGQ